MPQPATLLGRTTSELRLRNMGHGRTWLSGLLCFDEEILVRVPAHKRCTGILGGSYVTDRVNPLIEETLGDHQAPTDPADGQVAFASQSVQRLRAGDTAAMG